MMIFYQTYSLDADAPRLYRRHIDFENEIAVSDYGSIGDPREPTPAYAVELEDKIFITDGHGFISPSRTGMFGLHKHPYFHPWRIGSTVVEPSWFDKKQRLAQAALDAFHARIPHPVLKMEEAMAQLEALAGTQVSIEKILSILILAEDEKIHYMGEEPTYCSPSEAPLQLLQSKPVIALLRETLGRREDFESILIAIARTLETRRTDRIRHFVSTTTKTRQQHATKQGNAYLFRAAILACIIFIALASIAIPLIFGSPITP